MIEQYTGTKCARDQARHLVCAGAPQMAFTRLLVALLVNYRPGPRANPDLEVHAQHFGAPLLDISDKHVRC